MLNNVEINLMLLLHLGLHVGGYKNKRNPLMDSYLIGYRESVCIFDLDLTFTSFKKISFFLKLVNEKNITYSINKGLLVDFSNYTDKKCFLQKTFYTNNLNKWKGGSLSNIYFQYLNTENKYSYFISLCVDIKLLCKKVALLTSSLNFNKKIFLLKFFYLKFIFMNINVYKDSIVNYLITTYNKKTINCLYEAKKLKFPSILFTNSYSNYLLGVYSIPLNTLSIFSISMIYKMLFLHKNSIL